MICPADSDPQRGSGVINIHAQDELAFCLACRNDHHEIAKWLYHLSLNTKRINIRSKDDFVFHHARANKNNKILRWLLSLYTKSDLIELKEYKLVRNEIERRKKSRIELIIYLNKRKFKLLDIHAIAIVWREYF